MQLIAPRRENIAYFLPRFCKKPFYFPPSCISSSSHPPLRMTLKTYLREKRSVAGLHGLVCSRSCFFRLPSLLRVEISRRSGSFKESRIRELTAYRALSLISKIDNVSTNDSFRFTRNKRDSRKINERRGIFLHFGNN